MNIEDAIKIVKEFNIKNRYRDGGKINTAIDTVLNYIEELEKRLKEKENIVKKSSLEAQKYFDMLMEVEYGRDTIPKQKIRDKVEILENLQKNFPKNEELKIKAIVLKELLEE